MIGPVIPVEYRKIIHGTVTLEKYVALAVNVTVFPNVTIDEGTVVGACSLVTSDLDPWGIYYGIPAKRVRNRRKDLILKYARELEIGNY